MLFIGDIHGNFSWYMSQAATSDCSLQLGDFGVGFPFDINDSHYCNYKEFNNYTYSFPPEFDQQHKWIRGNHDWPELCRKHSNYLGDYGYLQNSGIFYISGAYSIDKDLRIVGVDWWENEQMPYNMLLGMIELYKDTRPNIVVSHDGPSEFTKYALDGSTQFGSITQNALDTCLDIHRPELWIFAHYHNHIGGELSGTKFQCVGDMRAFEIKDITW